MQPSIGRQAQVIAVVLAAALCAEADTIVEYTSGVDQSGPAFFGQRFTTPGDAYSLERYTWLKEDGSTNMGAGKLWLLSQEYSGTPDGLSAATTGYVADSSTYGASEADWYTFSSTPELSPSTNYWAYISDAKVPSPGMGYATGTPNDLYTSTAGTSVFNKVPGYSGNFRAEGSQAAVPEPGTLALFGVITMAGGLVARRRRKRKA